MLEKQGQNLHKMKKTIIFGIFLLFTIHLMGQTKTEEYREVVKTDLLKDQMWQNLKQWVPLAFMNYEHLIEMEDQVAGIMIVKWYKELPIVEGNYSMQKGYINFLMESYITIEIKDYEYSYVIPFGTLAVTLTEPNTGSFQLAVNPETKLISKEFKLIKKISGQYYNDSNIWSIDNTYNLIIEKYTKRGVQKDIDFLMQLKESYDLENLRVKNSLIINFSEIVD